MAGTKQIHERENPFRPGPGQAPPLLAGRGREQDILGTRIRGLTKGGSRRFFSIYGPRGMGKTALLDWVVKEAQRSNGAGGAKVSVSKASADEMLASEESLLAALVPQQRRRGRTEVGVKAELATVGGASFTTASAPGDIQLSELRSALIAACSKTPMVLLVDEAHVVNDADLYRLFLNVAQGVAQDAPFLLVLAGTPNLPAALSSTGAGFISRAEVFGIGLLEQGGAENAIRVPLEKGGIQIDDNALASVVEDAQRYPYFLQFWGHALWNVAQARGARRLTMRDTEAVHHELQGEKDRYYAERYLEATKNAVAQAAAWAVAGAFKDAERFHRLPLTRVVREALAAHLPADKAEASASEQLKELHNLGFIWCQPGEVVYRPGIPSLMDYTRAMQQDELSLHPPARPPAPARSAADG